MNKKQNVIPIFFATDDTYVPFLSVTLRSLIDNANKNLKYKVHILNCGLTPQNLKLLSTFSTDFVEIEFNDLSNKILKIKELLDEKLRDYYSNAIYYRIFIPSMFKEYSRAIYLDCDMVVLEDISKLFNINLKNNWLGVVFDEVIANKKEFQDYATYGVGVKYQNYFNSGMLLMDLNKLRENDIESNFIYLLNKYNFDTLCPDQDCLNVLCKDNVLYLDNGWNKMSTEKKYDGNLYIIHYNMFKKPWLFDDVPYEKYFWNYAKQTPFYNEILNIKNSFTKEQEQAIYVSNERLVERTIEIVNSDKNFYKVLNKKVSLADNLKLDILDEVSFVDVFANDNKVKNQK